MLDLVNFRPSVPQTDYYCCCFFAGSAAEKEKKREENWKSQKNRKTMKNDLRLMLVPTTFMFWVSFLPVPEWCCCNAGLGQFPALCPPDGLLLLFFFAGSAAEKGKEKRRKRKISEKLKTQRQEKNTPLHFQKSQKNLKTHNQSQNLLKIS